MDDLISRQAAIEAVGINTWAGFRLKDLPSAQSERKKGKWVRDEFGSKCPCCGLYAYRDEWGDPWESNFCPNCGADMRG